MTMVSKYAWVTGHTPAVIGNLGIMDRKAAYDTQISDIFSPSPIPAGRGGDAAELRWFLLREYNPHYNLCSMRFHWTIAKL